MEVKDILTLVGISVSFIVGAAGLIIGIKNSKKTVFINSITSSRIKYIQDIRYAISEYCGLFYRYKILVDHESNLSNEKLEVLRNIDKLKYQIILYLDPENTTWDKTITRLINEMRVHIEKNPENKINELITITQYLLKLEWEGAKLESQKGLINKRTKERLSKKYYDLYLSSKKSETIEILPSKF